MKTIIAQLEEAVKKDMKDVNILKGGEIYLSILDLKLQDTFKRGDKQ